MSEGATNKPLRLSVVIPAYNAADWLRPTTEKLTAAMHTAGINEYEIIIVNDGSTDSTKAVGEELERQGNGRLKVLSYENSGRYLTRKRGVEAARYDRILFIDTRVWIDEGAIKFLQEQIEEHPDRIVWNGHINVAKKGNIIARFGDAITMIGWRRYFGKPRLISYGIEDFDHYPKGTTLICLPRDILEAAFAWFEANTADIKNSSDDTLLIRHIAGVQRIWLSPEFSATYFARTTLKAFIKHTYYRGQFFVDGFLRKGTRFYYPLLGFLVGSVAVVVMCMVWPAYIWPLLIIFVILWLLELMVAIVMKLSIKDALSLFSLSPVFALVYGIGIWRAVLRRFLK